MAQKGFIEPGEKPRRFYETVTVAETADGWQVLLDGRPPRSSRGAALRTPTRDLAELAAAEWEAQAQHVDLAAGLCARQAAAWGPVLVRARDELGVALVSSGGILHRDQPVHALEAVRQQALSADDFTLSGLAFGAPLFGSAVLTLGLWRGWFGGEEAYALSRLDEAWQEEQWGIDEEAAQRTARLQAEARMLEAWFRGLGALPVSPA